METARGEHDLRVSVRACRQEAPSGLVLPVRLTALRSTVQPSMDTSIPSVTLSPASASVKTIKMADGRLEQENAMSAKMDTGVRNVPKVVIVTTMESVIRLQESVAVSLTPRMDSSPERIACHVLLGTLGLAVIANLSASPVKISMSLEPQVTSSLPPMATLQFPTLRPLSTMKSTRSCTLEVDQLASSTLEMHYPLGYPLEHRQHRLVTDPILLCLGAQRTPERQQ